MYFKPPLIQKCKHLILFLLLSSLFQPILQSVLFFNSNVCYVTTGQIVNIPHKFNYQFSKSFSTSIKPSTTFYQPLIISFITKLDYKSEFKRRQTRSMPIRSLITSNKCPQVTFALEITLNNLENANHPMKHLTNYFNNVNHIGRVSHNSSSNKKYTLNTKVLFNTWNEQINDTLITNQKRRPIQQTDVFSSPTEQLIEHYNCGDLNETLSRMSLTQSTPSDSVLLSTSSSDYTTTMNETNTISPITMIRKNTTIQQQKFPNKVNNISKSHNYRTQSLPSSQSTSSYFIDKEIANLLSPSQVQTLIDLEKYLNEELIVRRNERMAHEIISKLKLAESLNQSAFFALGAAHFIGSRETIIDHLRKAGYIIIPVPQQNTIRTEERINEISEEPLKFEKFNKMSKKQIELNDGIFPIREQDVPEFRPKYVKFDNSWIKIEDFKPRTLVNYNYISTSNIVKQSSKLFALETSVKYSTTKHKQLQQLQHNNKHKSKNQKGLQLLVSASNRLHLTLTIRTKTNIITNQCILFYTAYKFKLF
ncbi:unnamed protein product [Schistosoma spindalis]|nr:unnamed protein product [Schistosoma spindale]